MNLMEQACINGHYAYANLQNLLKRLPLHMGGQQGGIIAFAPLSGCELLINKRVTGHGQRGIAACVQRKPAYVRRVFMDCLRAC